MSMLLELCLVGIFDNDISFAKSPVDVSPPQPPMGCNILTLMHPRGIIFHRFLWLKYTGEILIFDFYEF